MNMNAVSNVPPPDPPDEPGLPAGGGEPPHGGMEKRLTVLETCFDTILPTLLTKTEFYRVMGDFRVDMETMRGEFGSELAKLRGEFGSALEKQRGEFGSEFEKLRGEMQKLRADVHAVFVSALKWVVGLTITLILSMAALGVSMSNTMRMVATQYERGPPAPPPAVVPDAARVTPPPSPAAPR